MEQIMGVLKQIGCLLLLFSLLEQLISDSKMQKYLRFFSGILLCVSLLQSVDDLLSVDWFEEITFSVEETEEYEDKFWEWEEKREQQIDYIYENQEEIEKDSDSMDESKIQIDSIQWEEQP